MSVQGSKHRSWDSLRHVMVPRASGFWLNIEGGAFAADLADVNRLPISAKPTSVLAGYEFQGGHLRLDLGA